jgi:hypothetical protein
MHKRGILIVEVEGLPRDEEDRMDMFDMFESVTVVSSTGVVTECETIEEMEAAVAALGGEEEAQ